MEKNLRTLHIQRKIWKGHTRNAICWAFYYANDDKESDPRNPQVMRCQFCYNSLVHAFNLNKKKKKRLKTYGLTTFKKHVDNDHAIIVKKIDEKVKLVKGLIERTICKNKNECFKKCNISVFFLLKIPFKRMMNNKKTFCRTLIFLL